MKNSSSIFLVIGAMAIAPATASAWYGPICYPDHIAHVSLTLQSLVGEAPGELKVSFDNNSGIVELETVRASKSVSGAHEIVLKRTAESENGIVGVIATSPRSSVGFKFELEFRKSAAECTGAILKVSASGDRSAENHPKAPARHSSQAPKMVFKKESKPKAAPQVEQAATPAVSPSASPEPAATSSPTAESSAAPVAPAASESSAASPAPQPESVPAPEVSQPSQSQPDQSEKQTHSESTPASP